MVLPREKSTVKEEDGDDSAKIDLQDFVAVTVDGSREEEDVDTSLFDLFDTDDDKDEDGRRQLSIFDLLEYADGDSQQPTTNSVSHDDFTIDQNRSKLFTNRFCWQAKNSYDDLLSISPPVVPPPVLPLLASVVVVSKRVTVDCVSSSQPGAKTAADTPALFSTPRA